MYFSGNSQPLKDFLDKHVTIIAIHKSATYAITVESWGGLRDFFYTHNPKDVDMEIKGKMWLEPSSYSYEAAFMEVFGKYVNLYKSDTNYNLLFDALQQGEEDPTTDITNPCD